jgi:hypothetical protein
MEEIKRIQISRNVLLNTLRFPDEKVIMSNSEDELQTLVHKLAKLIGRYWIGLIWLKIGTSGGLLLTR